MDLSAGRLSALSQLVTLALLSLVSLSSKAARFFFLGLCGL
jgi:hypothetical protein